MESKQSPEPKRKHAWRMQRRAYLQARMGRESIATTLHRYRHVLPDAKRRWSPPPRRLVTREEVERLCAFLRTTGGVDGLRREIVVRLAYECVLRPGEIRALRWSDIDLDERHLLIRRSFVSRRVPWHDIPSRCVPLTPVLTALLGELVQQEAGNSRWESDGWLLPGRNGHSVGQAALRQIILRGGTCGGDAWNAEPPRLHDLRRSGMALMVAHGIPLAEVARIAGFPFRVSGDEMIGGA